VTNLLSFPHQVTRLVFDAGQPYEKFRSRYEAAVPPADPPWLGETARRHVRWHDVIADAGQPSPDGFVLHWRADMAPLMTTGGELRPGTAYLMGHYAATEKIYRQDPAVMLYMPLRTLIYIDLNDRTRLTVDQPSTVFASFAEPAIAEYGVDLDRQLGELLSALGVEATPVPAAASTAPQTTSRNGVNHG
jgi:hypothetical protein